MFAQFKLSIPRSLERKESRLRVEDGGLWRLDGGSNARIPSGGADWSLGTQDAMLEAQWGYMAGNLYVRALVCLFTWVPTSNRPILVVARRSNAQLSRAHHAELAGAASEPLLRTAWFCDIAPQSSDVRFCQHRTHFLCIHEHVWDCAKLSRTCGYGKPSGHRDDACFPRSSGFSAS